MAKSKVLINKTTGKEFPTTDADKVLERFPKTFRMKPDAQVSDEVKKAEAAITDQTIDELSKEISTIENADDLRIKLSNEKNGSKRKGAISAIEARIKELEPEGSNN